jgi:hypothetical protein
MTRDCDEGGQTRLPGRVEIGAGGKAAIKLENHHAVGEIPGGSCQVRVADRLHERRGGARFDTGAETFPRQRSRDHHPVEMRVRPGEDPVRGGDLWKRILTVRHRRSPARGLRVVAWAAMNGVVNAA